MTEGTTGQSNKHEALRQLQEALKLFQHCLDLQESQFARAEHEQQINVETSTLDHGEISRSVPSSPTSGASIQEQWASIVEPITKDTLLDTCIAQIETLTDICGLITSQDRDEGLLWIEEYLQSILNSKLALYEEGGDRKTEISLVKANLTCAYADASFRTGRHDLPTYEQELGSAFDPALDLSGCPRGLCDRAEALLTFNSSVRAAAGVVELQERNTAYLNQIQWKHLSSALVDLKAASVLAEAQNLPRIHMRRGDCELLRFRLGEAPSLYLPAQANATMLLKNAGVYYRGAASAAMAEKSSREELEALVKDAVVAMLEGDIEKTWRLSEKQGTEQIWEDMLEEGLIDERVIQRLNDKIPT